MKPIFHPRAAVLALALVLAAASVSAAQAQTPGPTTSPTRRAAPMPSHASGTFDVRMTPQNEDRAEGTALGRMSLDKQFHGALEATGKGEMLTAVTEVGSAVYVAIERVTGTLDGRAGSFVLAHQGTMTRDGQQLSIKVVPDSGTGQLTGLSGRMTITIEGGKHSYGFEYTLPPA